MHSSKQIVGVHVWTPVPKMTCNAHDFSNLEAKDLWLKIWKFSSFITVHRFRIMLLLILSQFLELSFLLQNLQKYHFRNRVYFGIISSDSIVTRGVHMYKGDGKLEDPADFDSVIKPQQEWSSSHRYLSSIVITSMLMFGKGDKFDDQILS